MKLPALYDEIFARVAEQGKTSTDKNFETDCDVQLTERQREILVLLQEDGSRIANVIATLN